MSDRIGIFFPRLADIPEIVELVEHYFGEQAHSVLERLKTGRDLGEPADEVEDLITEFVAAHATEVATFQGLGQVENSSKEAMNYFEKYHPEAHEMMLARTQELQKLLGKDGAAAALGQSREPFAIRVFHYGFLYIVTAEEFQDTFFDNENEAVEFAQTNYKPFIEIENNNNNKEIYD